MLREAGYFFKRVAPIIAGTMTALQPVALAQNASAPAIAGTEAFGPPYLQKIHNNFGDVCSVSAPPIKFSDLSVIAHPDKVYGYQQGDVILTPDLPKGRYGTPEATSVVNFDNAKLLATTKQKLADKYGTPDAEAIIKAAHEAFLQCRTHFNDAAKSFPLQTLQHARSNVHAVEYGGGCRPDNSATLPARMLAFFSC